MPPERVGLPHGEEASTAGFNAEAWNSEGW
jgi:hypothetical protein